MGKEGQYDLRLADSASSIVKPETETEDESSFIEMNLNGNSHPTKLLKTASMKMMKMLSVNIGLYGDRIESTAIRNIASMFRSLLQSRGGIASLGLDHWATLGFLRAIAQPKQLTRALTSPLWMSLHIEIINGPISCDLDVFKKVQSIRLLHSTLVHWDAEDSDRIENVVEKLFECLGRVTLFSPNDLSQLQASIDVKSRVLLTASNSGTIAEELIALMRKLHSLPLWNGAISAHLLQKLCNSAELFSEMSETSGGRDSACRILNSDAEKAQIVAALNIIGGYDPRPRIGQRIQNDGMEATITTFTDKGKALISFGANAKSIEKKKITIASINAGVDVIPFNMNRLPMNEMLLNAFTVLLFGPGEWRPKSKASLDVALLRTQQTHLAALNASGVLFKHQNLLRKILRQRCPGISRYPSNESINEQQDSATTSGSTVASSAATKAENLTDEKRPTPEPSRKSSSLTRNQKAPSANASEDGLDEELETHECEENEDKLKIVNELLVQNILSRATQANPLKSIYSFDELALAALNLTQQLASCLYAENSAIFSTQAIAATTPCAQVTKPPLPPVQPTLIHGVPIYNEAVSENDRLIS